VGLVDGGGYPHPRVLHERFAPDCRAGAAAHLPWCMGIWARLVAYTFPRSTPLRSPAPWTWKGWYERAGYFAEESFTFTEVTQSL